MCKCPEFLEFADDLEFGIPKFRSHGWFSFGRVGVCLTTSLYKRYVREDLSYTHAFVDFPDPTGPKGPGRLQCVGKILTCFSTFANSAVPWAVLIFCVRVAHEACHMLNLHVCISPLHLSLYVSIFAFHCAQLHAATPMWGN